MGGGPAMAPPTVDRIVAANRDGKVTRDVVLAAALQIIDRDGIVGLSMRRLARALDRDPMILYRHAPNKAALLDGVAETVLAQLMVDSADPDWAAPPGGRRRDGPPPAHGGPRRPRLGRPAARRRPRLPRAGAGPPECGAAAGHPAAGHPARAPPTRHPAPARRHPHPAHPRRVQRT